MHKEIKDRSIHHNIAAQSITGVYFENSDEPHAISSGHLRYSLHFPGSEEILEEVKVKFPKKFSLEPADLATNDILSSKFLFSFVFFNSQKKCYLILSFVFFQTI